NRTVTGKITNEQGAPLVATITAKSTSNVATSSDESGFYSLSVPETADSLIVNAIGYLRKTVAIRNNIADVQLQADGNYNLDEVVVIGYGTQRKGDLTAPVATVN